MPKLVAFDAVQETRDLHVLRPARQQAVHLVRESVVLVLRLRRHAQAERVPLIDHCTSNAALDIFAWRRHERLPEGRVVRLNIRHTGVVGEPEQLTTL